jgi:magnesium transporter
MAFGPEEFAEEQPPAPDRVAEYLGKYPVLWLNVDGLGDPDVLRRIGETFDLHPLALEDVVNVHQRPKVEHYPQHLFFVARMLGIQDPRETEQLSLFLGKNYLLTFQEKPGDCFETIRQRIRQKQGRVRSCGPDYLAYLLIDAVVDNYFPALERCGERLDEVEQQVLVGPDPSVVKPIYAIKNELLVMRRAIWPLRDVMNNVFREQQPLISSDTRVFWRDCYDHTVQILDILESEREASASLIEIYMSSLSNRTNDIMKVLAIMTTLFIPLSFIASLEGMNFEQSRSPWNMPELKWYWGYPMILMVMTLVGLGEIYYFWKKGWIWRRRR